MSSTRTFASQFRPLMRAETLTGIHSLARAPREQIGYQRRIGGYRGTERETGQTDRRTETAPPGACTNTPTTHPLMTDDDALRVFLALSLISTLFFSCGWMDGSIELGTHTGVAIMVALWLRFDAIAATGINGEMAVFFTSY